MYAVLARVQDQSQAHLPQLVVVAEVPVSKLSDKDLSPSSKVVVTVTVVAKSFATLACNIPLVLIFV